VTRVGRSGEHYLVATGDSEFETSYVVVVNDGTARFAPSRTSTAGRSSAEGWAKHAGLYVVGVNWLHKRKSALFCGVGEDAEHVASQLVARAD
jgi:hypothetical protein